MAQTSAVNLVEGFTRLVGASGPGARVRPSGIIIQDNGGFDYYLWVDTAGVIRTTDAATAEAPGFNWNTGGTKVGAQV